MFNKILKAIIGITGMLIGYGISVLIFWILNLPAFSDMIALTARTKVIISGVCILVFGLIFFFITPALKNGGIKIARRIESDLQKVPSSDMVSGTAGLVIGLIIAYLISQLFVIIDILYIGTILSILTYIFLGYLGISIATKKGNDLLRNLPTSKKNSAGIFKGKNKFNDEATPKILDTSVIIDGRISDIIKTGFIEGNIILPEFVLEELRHIADSSDALKRNRGRRGLDILNRIQKDRVMDVQITDKDFEDVSEVDIKLLKLAQHIGGKVVTNDYNLNKVAELHGVEVLNINELANSLKPIVLPGEDMLVTVIKEGKEMNQGVAYLDDGTMIVVEEGRKHIGDTINVTVTSVLQTAAGRMIFAKSKSMPNNKTA
ncbi:MAG: PIN/TRAM domain-containing protein [Clostridia bacterium]|nr:PIN/TRAM domain-containing protein [Clostridia bacterium]